MKPTPLIPKTVALTKRIKLECYKAQEEGGVGSLRILVADDEEGMLTILQIILERQKHEIVAMARNGKEAIEMAKLHRPDIILMDIAMPVVDGLTAAETILKEYSCPIIFTTGMSDDRTLKRARKIHAQAYLVKPFTGAQLKSSLQMALGSHSKSLRSEVEISLLRQELEGSQVVESALQRLMQSYNLNREDALDQLTSMAATHGVTLHEAAVRARGSQQLSSVQV